MTPLITTREVAELLHLHPKTVERMARRNEIPVALKIGRSYRFNEQAVRARLAR